jgi:hypothetical protein
LLSQKLVSGIGSKFRAGALGFARRKKKQQQNDDDRWGFGTAVEERGAGQPPVHVH